MNRAQQMLVGGGAVVAGLLGLAAAKQLDQPGLNCKDEIVGFEDRRGRWVMAKSRTCD